MYYNCINYYVAQILWKKRYIYYLLYLRLLHLPSLQIFANNYSNLIPH